MWQGIQAMTNYRTTSVACDKDASLPDVLNNFYARFEVQNDVVARKNTPPPNDQVLCLTMVDVRKTLRRVNPRKAAGPDNIPGRVLRGCADQLADVLTDIFNISLSSAVIPTCFKATTIIPMPKKSSVSFLNDYRPSALTPIIMKCFERLIMRHIKTQLPPSLDPLQFAYRPNRSTDDAIATTLHLALTHLDKKGLIRSNAVHKFQLSIQQDNSSAPDWKAEPAGPGHLPLQLDPGLPDWETSVSPDREQHLHHHHTEHWGPPGLCAQSTAVHSADSQLCSIAQLEPHR
ncbi:uncharacterized protein LOC127641324 [Xyrauchen texanus]|uniref:uncharacterized protein LOC127641324 n=1 Tax=Xyrauchen texanus TaxID=154827 RepID=UPI002241F2E5|nr:uncharacterized protein LOC127641324 [Xyrauchen texanus]